MTLYLNVESGDVVDGRTGEKIGTVEGSKRSVPKDIKQVVEASLPQDDKDIRRKHILWTLDIAGKDIESGSP